MATKVIFIHLFSVKMPQAGIDKNHPVNSL